MWAVVFLSVAVLAWICLVLSVYAIPLKEDAPTSPQDILRTAQTGDVLLFIAKDYGLPYTLVNPYSHIAVIVRTSDNGTYVVEAHNDNSGPGDQYPKGIAMYPLEQRAAPTAFTTPYFVRLHRAAEPRILTPEALANQVRQWNAAIEYNKSYKVTEALCHFLGIRPDVTKKMHCANFASMFLEYLGIASPQAVYDCIRPIDVVSTLPLAPGYAYKHITPVNTTL